MARRYDTQELGTVERLPTGGIRVPAALARTGIQIYRNPDGSPRREYRPPEEVFAPAALSGLRGAPVTQNHPSTGRVDTADWRVLAVGHVGEDVRPDGTHVTAHVYVQDASTIAEVERGTLREVSLGYDTDYDPTPGVSPEGEPYDGVQRNIRVNHAALVPMGRAGRSVGLRLDHQDNQILSEVKVEISIAGKKYIAGTPEADKALADLQTRLDAAEKAVQVARRREVAAQSKSAGVTVRLDASPEEMMVDTLKKLAPSMDLEGASPDYIMGAFAAAIAIKLAADAAPAADSEEPEEPPQAPPGQSSASVRADVVESQRAVLAQSPVAVLAAPGESPAEIARRKMVSGR